MSDFVHLRVHSEYSLTDGLVRIKALAARVAEFAMPAVGVTDVCNFYGLIKFHKAAVSAGIKPIFGADVWVADSLKSDDAHPLCLLVMNSTGYLNLTRLLSRAYREGQTHEGPRVLWEWLSEGGEGLLALSCGAAGEVGQALVNEKTALAKERMERCLEVFPGRFYLELHRTGRDGDEEHVHAALDLAAQYACPVVATNDVRFLHSSEFEAHEARVCIAESRVLDDPRRQRRYSEEQYLRSADEMRELFADVPEAIENTVAIAKRCSMEMELGRVCLPDFPVPEGMTMDTFFRELSHRGLDERLVTLQIHSRENAQQLEKDYRARLDFELDTIIDMGFPGYFLIVMDFIRWAKERGIPVGPGRGSGAGSLVAYSLSITDLDPMEYELLFERFLNPERVSMPDFDVDFCMERRDEVIDYVAETYGREAVSQIITFGTLAAKAVVRDVARVQGKSYGLGDRLSKMIPFEVGMTLEKALEQEESLQQFLRDDGEAQEIWDMAVQLEGVTRNVGKHAGGVVIAPSQLTDFSALYCDGEGAGLVTQFDKNDVEDAGLVKFDFLGLRTLTIIDWAQGMINEIRARRDEPPLDINQIPLDDEASFDLLRSAETTAVFQLESRGMKELIARLRPDSFEDIIALVALYRPGPLQSGMVDNFIDRKHGREKVSYPDADYQHELLQPVLEPTYGIILYQEQVMQIAQILAGYTLGGADLLRRAMGKKKPEEMAKQRSVFAAGAADKGVDADLATKLFDLVEKFAGYGFNKSHSAAYALVSYQTAWLKSHYPAAFMAAVMSSELDNTDKIVVFIEECRRMGLTVRLPDVNEGRYMFTVSEAGEIVYGLGAIKGLGEGPVSGLLESREEQGPFRDLFDFCARTDPRKLNRKALEALVRSGAFDSLGTDRWILLGGIDDALRAAEQNAANRDAGMVDLFGETVQASREQGDPYAELRHVRPWTDRERLQGERDTLGLYVTGHPIDSCEDELRRFAPQRLADLRTDSRGNCRVAGLILNMRAMKSARGAMAIFVLDDRSARLEATAYSEVYQQYRELLVKDQIVIAEGRLSQDDRSGASVLRVSALHSLAEERARLASGLTIHVDASELNDRFREFLRNILSTAPGECPVRLRYHQGRQSASLMLGQQWRVSPSEELLEELRRELGGDRVKLAFDKQLTASEEY
ncbi:DNA polymerase III subunit alpha [Congregibacter sp.]|uniref:DNA polymerase III subunit alpha n=1 Tax=Congregibacter sp. TaxID=2744308 RepID=UPI003F6C08ED